MARSNSHLFSSHFQIYIQSNKLHEKMLKSVLVVLTHS
uniref:Uncharacterized protein n=1 Tax=Rhizophora mucronata TaxID=61149 RepID=A0A2P2PFU3_RHIMU